MIDLWYIGGDPDERTKDYIANGLRTRRTFQDRFPGRSGPLPALGPDWDEVKERARRWKDVSIEIRAKGTPLEDTYHELYRFGSSLDHSDAWSANQYVASREGATLSINNGPSDDLVSIALGYALQAMIVLVEVLCRAFAITERTRLDVLLAEFKRLEKFNGPRET